MVPLYATMGESFIFFLQRLKAFQKIEKENSAEVAQVIEPALEDLLAPISYPVLVKIPKPPYIYSSV